MGAKAIKLLMNGKSGRAIGMKNNELIDLDIDEALSQEKVFNQDMYELTKVLSI